MKKKKNQNKMSKNTNFLSLFFTGVMVLITFFGYSASKTENEIVVLNENDPSFISPLKETPALSLYPDPIYEPSSILAFAKDTLDKKISTHLKDLEQNSILNPITAEKNKIEIKNENIKNSLLSVLSTDKVLAYNLNSNKSLFSSQEKNIWPTASLAKLMTAIIAVEKMGFEKEVKITPEAIAIENEAGNFQAVEVFKIRDLLLSIFLVSSNDAAFAIANEYGQENFIAEMNKKAKELEMSNTYFSDPAGLSAASISTASDLSKLAAYIIKERPELLYLSRQKEIEIKDQRFGDIKKYESINKFSTRNDFIGGKTGYTDIAQENLFSLFYVKNETILIIILGSKDRFGDTEKILDSLSLLNL